MSWYLAALKKYADFSGRARRMEYWYYTLFNTIFSIVVALIGQLLGGNSGYEAAAGVYLLATILPSLAVSVRRLHDTGRSGWWIFISLVPLIGAIILLIFYIEDSKPGSNQWGPNPKEVTASGMATV